VKENLSEDKKPFPDWLRTLPYWFALALGLVYSTGFLIDYTFHNSIGIHFIDDATFKAQYVYIGVICTYAPISAGLMLHGVLITKRQGKDRSYWATTIIIVMMLLTIDALTAFVSPGFFQREEIRIAIIFTVGIGGPTFLRYYESIRDKKKLRIMYPPTFAGTLHLPATKGKIATLSEQPHFYKGIIGILAVFLILILIYNFYAYNIEKIGFYSFIYDGILYPICAWGSWLIAQRYHARDIQWRAGPRWLLVIITASSILITFESEIGLAGEILYQGGWLYIGLLFLVYCIGLTMVESNISHKSILFAISLLLPLALLYFSIIVFAYRIYPYIPYSRGGGDYSRGGRAATLYFSTDNAPSFPSEIVDNENLSFHPEDIVNTDKLINDICYGNSPIAVYIMSRIREINADDYAGLLNKSLDSNSKIVILCEYLNWMIRTPHIFDSNSIMQFSSHLDEFTPEAYGSNISLVEENRKSLEMAFPGFSIKSQEPQGSISWPVTILAETSDMIYVTPDILQSTRANWRRVGPENKPHKILAIKRDLISTIIYREISSRAP